MAPIPWLTLLAASAAASVRLAPAPLLGPRTAPVLAGAAFLGFAAPLASAAFLGLGATAMLAPASLLRLRAATVSASAAVLGLRATAMLRGTAFP